MKKILKVVLLISVVLFAVSFFIKDRYPRSENILDQLYYEPAQVETGEPEFSVTIDDTVYTITPLYEYELTGLVVSYHNSNSWWDYYHAKWGDTLNVKDICVLWSGNVRDNLYDEFKFSSSDFYCSYHTKSSDAFSRFDRRAFSNNHLLADSRQTNNVIMSVKRGDQIYLRGYLANYSSDKDFSRKTSVTREDTEGGACEIIFLTDFQVLKRSNPAWDTLNTVSRYALIFCLIILTVMFFTSKEP